MTPTTKPITCRLPSTLLNAVRLKLEVSPPCGTEPLHLDYFVYFLSKIASIPITNNKYKNLQKVPISSVILRNEMGKNYKRYVEYLIEHKFVETDNYYIVGDTVTEGKCKCYCISKKFRMENFVEVKLDNKFLLSKVLKWKMKRFGKDSNDPLISKIYQMIENFKVDIPSATEYLQQLVDNKGISKKTMQLELDKCHRINNGDASNMEHFVIKDKYNRVHTNFTNLSKHIRENFLYVNGKKVASIDIQTCQPSLLYVLFNDYIGMVEKANTKPLEIDGHFERSDIRDKYVNASNDYAGNVNYGGQVNFEYNTFGMSATEFLRRVKIESSCYERVLYNDIYDYFADEWENFYSESISRSKIKKHWITYVFGKDVSDYTVKIHHIWATYFPIFTKMLSHFKKDDYKTLAHSLQKSESAIMFDKLFPALENELDCFTTVHDCILLPTDECDNVINIFEGILQSNNIITGVKLT